MPPPPPPPQFCPAWCAQKTQPWEGLCTWNGCGGCTECPVVLCASTETHNLIDFSLATLQNNNLGGAGPDPDDSPENMHLASVGMTADGEPFDLIITSETEYVPRNAANHNGINGAIPQINLGQNETVTLRFDFVDSNGQPVVLSEFFFTYYDLDQETDLPSGAESLTASGFVKYDVDPNTELDISTAPDGSVTFSSTRRGTLDDNPTDPLSLTSEQLSRSVTLLYRDTSTVRLTYSTTAAVCSPTPCGGRNFLFAGVNPFPVVDPCCLSPRGPPPFPPPQPPPPPALPVPPSSPCICASDETHNLIDFSLATLQNNNLGGAGPDPDDSPENMHLASVGMTADGEPFDLIITSETEYVPRNAANHNGINGAIPQINLGQNETVTLRFDFVDSNGQPVVLSEFFFTYYDLDQETDLPSGAESLTASGFVKYDVDPNTELDISTALDGSVTFSSTRRGTLDDNPTDPLSLTSEQRSRSVTLLYRDTSTVRLTYSTTAAVCSPTPCGGRNFLFAGVDCQGSPSPACNAFYESLSSKPFADAIYAAVSEATSELLNASTTIEMSVSDSTQLQIQTTFDSPTLIEILQSSNDGPCSGTTLCTVTVVTYNSSSTADCGPETVTAVVITREYLYSNDSEFETLAQPVANLSMQAARNVTNSDCLNQTIILDAATKAISARVTA
ncbi:hypothetical protein EMIHUDRAFT_198762 [Emiliania huxleyi CCMP1516]|uniref:Uncharacterized protein n=2 Tax=Emiliania huxleyi TaxID=2903 RepID=A0A0D3I7T8_EMIH1|nr:hypothetical protein EMIHUDRAFT_198762 [Emiliania huxleyi CCMP1516]EOD07323.1 hypothetical protein EMIHUDRAFT_198762 [Emiliania huxleyi CCMP1516]|eukprot:XP_005759752.1 hypothetical protein EMIHUDRAFT_198762 [Emiliania huxleyi CCMP1516]